jgi:hypothetical protein
MDYSGKFFNDTPIPFGIGTKLTSTAPTTIYTAQGNNLIEAVDWLHIANITGTSTTVTVEWVDTSESTTIVFMKDATVAGNTAVQFRLGFQLEADDEIRVTAADANAIDVIAQIVQMARSS